MFDFNTVLDLNSLPVAPEFIEILTENATRTAVDYLETIHAPAHLVDLIRNIQELGYYLEECYRKPTPLLTDRSQRFDIESTVFHTINLIAQSGGVFHGPGGDYTMPRQHPAPMQIGGPE